MLASDLRSRSQSAKFMLTGIRRPAHQHFLCQDGRRYNHPSPVDCSINTPIPTSLARSQPQCPSTNSRPSEPALIPQRRWQKNIFKSSRFLTPGRVTSRKCLQLINPHMLSHRTSLTGIDPHQVIAALTPFNAWVAANEPGVLKYQMHRQKNPHTSGGGEETIIYTETYVALFLEARKLCDRMLLRRKQIRERRNSAIASRECGIQGTSGAGGERATVECASGCEDFGVLWGVCIQGMKMKWGWMVTVMNNCNKSN